MAQLHHLLPRLYRARLLLQPAPEPPAPPSTDALLLESGDYFLLESGDRLLLEEST